MPTYEYQCPEGHSFELFQKMSDDPVASCPECGAAAERLISGGSGFLFRGAGFYITETRSEAYKKQASKESGAPAESGSTGGSGDKSGGGQGDKGSGGSGSKGGGEGGSGSSSAKDAPSSGSGGGSSSSES